MLLNDGVHDAQRLKELRALPLERKIMISQARIIEWHNYWNGNVVVSFSGGKDSTVLLHMARQIFPEVKGVFVNTGLEFPEIQKLVRKTDNVEILTPRWGQRAKKYEKYGKKPENVMWYKDVLTIYGYPLISKEVSQVIGESRSKPYGAQYKKLYTEDGISKQYQKTKWVPLYHIPIKISDKCCYSNKKLPIKHYKHKNRLTDYVATLTEEGAKRKSAWIKNGCNAFNSSDPKSQPMSFWTEQDVLRYIKMYNLELASVYGDIVYEKEPCEKYPNGKLKCTGSDRTGCMFCPFGVHLTKKNELSRFQLLKTSHPRQYEYAMSGGEWIDNPNYNSLETNPDVWNPKQLWVPTKEGLGFAKVFDMVNDIYGKDFIRYE